MTEPANPFKTPGAFSWSELMTGDPEGAGAFYSELFGWAIRDAGPEMGHYNVIMLPGEQGIGGIMQTPLQTGDHSAAWGVYVTVEDTDATVAKATELGAEVLMPAQDIPKVGRFAWLRDPQGATFAVIAYSMAECEG